MRIISSFKDYYDYAYGYSTYPVWRRNTSTVDILKKDIPAPVTNFAAAHIKGTRNIKVHVLSVCGTFFPIYELSDNYFSNLYQVKSYIETYIPIHTEIDHTNFYKKIVIPKDIEYKPYNYDNNRRLYIDPYSHNEPLVLYRNPYRYIYDYTRTVISNPELKDMRISEVLPTYDIYQRIDLWLINRTSNDTITNTGDDKDLLISKGFNPKLSFRTRKS